MRLIFVLLLTGVQLSYGWDNVNCGHDNCPRPCPHQEPCCAHQRLPCNPCDQTSCCQQPLCSPQQHLPHCPCKQPCCSNQQPCIETQCSPCQHDHCNHQHLHKEPMVEQCYGENPIRITSFPDKIVKYVKIPVKRSQNWQDPICQSPAHTCPAPPIIRYVPLPPKCPNPRPCYQHPAHANDECDDAPCSMCEQPSPPKLISYLPVSKPHPVVKYVPLQSTCSPCVNSRCCSETCKKPKHECCDSTEPKCFTCPTDTFHPPPYKIRPFMKESPKHFKLVRVVNGPQCSDRIELTTPRYEPCHVPAKPCKIVKYIRHPPCCDDDVIPASEVTRCGSYVKIPSVKLAKHCNEIPSGSPPCLQDYCGKCEYSQPELPPVTRLIKYKISLPYKAQPPIIPCHDYPSTECGSVRNCPPSNCPPNYGYPLPGPHKYICKKVPPVIINKPICPPVIPMTRCSPPVIKKCPTPNCYCYRTKLVPAYKKTRIIPAFQTITIHVPVVERICKKPGTPPKIIPGPYVHRSC